MKTLLSRLKNSLLFRIEQLMMRGTVARFGIIVFFVLAVSLVAGVLVRQLAPGFESTEDAVWWAFLRLTDPGYLGDDEGVAKATVSTVVTVLGYILFMGALIAILVQWLRDTMDRLELGLTPVVLDAHFLILGWTSRTPVILEEIMVSQGRVERFLRERGVRRLRVVLLVERATASLRREIRLQLGAHWNARQIVLRSGSPLRLDDLSRVDFTHAGAILIPAADTTAGSSIDADTRTVKTLLTMVSALAEKPPEELPLVVLEIQDTRHIETLRGLYRGPMEIIAADVLISRLIVQNIRQPGLSHVYAEFLSDVIGSQIYVREEPQLAGVSVHRLNAAFAEGVLLGVVRPRADGFQALLNPPNDLRLEAGDRIVVLAPRYVDPVPPETNDPTVELPQRAAPKCEVRARRRVLVLGWNHRIPALMREFASYPEETFTIDIVSQVSASKREKRLAVETFPKERLEVRQLELDYAIPAYLDSVDPAGYDNIVLLASERLKSGAESDARTILGYLLLSKLTPAGARMPPVLVELNDPDNISLLEDQRGEIIVSPLIASHMLARVTLRRELRAVFDELFSSGGCEISFHRIADYDLTGTVSPVPESDAARSDLTFADLQRVADARGEIALGLRRAGQERTPRGAVELAPPRDKPLQVNGDDELIVLTT